MSEVVVLSWRYGDGSGTGILRAYMDRKRAEEDFQLLGTVEDSKTYFLTVVEIF